METEFRSLGLTVLLFGVRLPPLKDIWGIYERFKGVLPASVFELWILAERKLSETTNQLTKSGSHPASQPSKKASKHASQASNQPANQPTSQPTDQTTNKQADIGHKPSLLKVEAQRQCGQKGLRPLEGQSLSVLPIEMGCLFLAVFPQPLVQTKPPFLFCRLLSNFHVLRGDLSNL